MDSPFQQHFSTNYTPSHEEECRIRALLSSYRQDIRDIDSEIEMLQQQMNTLYEKRKKIEEFADKHQELIAPIRMLSQDILECIFLACLPEDRNPGMSKRNAPMLLTHICSSWRRIAMSTPHLWTRFHITIPAIRFDRFALPGTLEKDEHQTCQNLTVRKLAVNQWLERSGACSLSISITQEPSVEGWHSDSEAEVSGYDSAIERIQQVQLSLIKNTIFSNHQRWHCLDLYVSDDIIRYLLEAGAKGDLCLDMLKKIHVTRRPACGSFSHRVMLPFHLEEIITILPSNTTSATLSNIPISYSADSIPKNFRWVQLTELNLHIPELHFPNGITAQQRDILLTILGHCPQLIAVKLMIDSIQNTTVGDPEAPTVLQHLTYLSISLPPTQRSLSFVKCLYLPSMKELDLHFTPFYDNDWLPHSEKHTEILESLVRVAEHIHTLRLFEPLWITSTDYLIRALKIIPTVKCLNLSARQMKFGRWDSISYNDDLIETRLQSIFSDSLLHALNPTLNQKAYSDVVCPRLEEFECDRKLLTSFSESALKDFLISRKTASHSDNRITSIQRLVVSLNNYKQEDDADSDEKISLGDDSAIYFRRRDIDSHLNQWYDYGLFSDMYTEL